LEQWKVRTVVETVAAITPAAIMWTEIMTTAELQELERRMILEAQAKAKV
jgi:hypothetical protein